MKRAAILLALFLLGGCAAGIGLPPADPPRLAVEPHLATDALIADDGARLPLRVWLPRGEVKAAVLALHGFNDYSNAFAGPAAAWAKQGIATYAYDQRGFGAAPDRGSWVGTRRLDADLALASRLVRARHPGVPLYLLGESMGGAVVITGVTAAAGAPRPEADGIILAAPAVWGRATMNIFERIALWTAYQLMPEMTVTGRGLHVQASDNIPMLLALGRDPLVIKETKVEAVEGLVDLMDQALVAAPRITAPMLLLYGERDQLIPAEPIRLLIDHLPSASAAARRIAWYPDGYHMLLRDLEAPLVLRDIESWIADRAEPLPSGADRRARILLAAGA